MSGLSKRYCVFGCDPLVTFGVPLHRFPNPEKNPDLFAKWVSIIGDNLKETDTKKIYSYKRVCDHHFDPIHKISHKHLKKATVPSVNLNRVQQSETTFVEADHAYSLRIRESFRTTPMVDITNLPTPSRFAVESSVEIPIPSASTATTCHVTTAAEKAQARKPHTKFNADKTFEFLENKSKTECAKKLRRKQNEIRRLRIKVKSFKLRLQQMQKTSVKKSFEKITENMTPEAKLFTRMQCIEGKKKRKGRRFTLDEKILSLSLYKKSPKGYNMMCKHFTLPSKKVLKGLLSQIKIYPGINPLIFEELKTTVSKMLPQDRLCTLMFDEMSITPQIHYNPYTDNLVGFEDFGNSKTEKFTNHALVFMVKGIKRNFKQPVAYYFVQNLQTNKLKDILTDIVKNVQATGLNIVATVCDQGSPNASCINSLIADAKALYLKLGKEWKKDVIIINKKEIIPLIDVPHLLKGIRNNLLNKDMEYKDENQIKTIKWEYFQRIFEADKCHGELRLLPKLSREHVDICWDLL